jgi:ribonuclease P protein component
MLPFKNRLTKRKEIERIQRIGHPVFLDNIVLKIVENGLPEPRIGFLVGSKSFRKAVERNQVKRLLREAIKPEISHIKEKVDILVIARRREGEKLTPEKIRANIKEVLKKAGFSKESATKENK